jgi:hypothetical protein
MASLFTAPSSSMSPSRLTSWRAPRTLANRPPTQPARRRPRGAAPDVLTDQPVYVDVVAEVAARVLKAGDDTSFFEAFGHGPPPHRRGRRGRGQGPHPHDSRVLPPGGGTPRPRLPPALRHPCQSLLARRLSACRCRFSTRAWPSARATSRRCARRSWSVAAGTRRWSRTTSASPSPPSPGATTSCSTPGRAKDAC